MSDYLTTPRLASCLQILGNRPHEVAWGGRYVQHHQLSKRVNDWHVDKGSGATGTTGPGLPVCVAALSTRWSETRCQSAVI
jgi:hypothetical protein